MGKIAFIFAGQGAQYPGMGQDLYNVSPAAREVFDMAQSIRPGTLEMCFSGTKEELSLTVNTQPALFAMDLACAAAATEAGICADGAAGFSLGEIAALAFSGILTYEDAFRLVCKRGEYMHACAEENKGSMAAVLRLDDDKVEQLCSQFKQVYPVNYNCSGQNSVAGAEGEMGEFVKLVAQSGGRAIPLAVSGAFHSPFMATASDQLRKELESMPLQSAKMPLYSNYTAMPYQDGEVAELIAMQVKSPVKWRKSVEQMIQDGFDTFIEVGAGKTLCGLVKKIDSSVRIFNIENCDSLAAAAEAVCGG